MAPGTAPLDTSVEIVTPENIAFRYHVAGPFRRLPAYLVDLALQILIFVASWFLLALGFQLLGLPGLGEGMLLVVMFILSWFYGGLFETYWNGQTPGKRMMRIRVLSTDGQPITGLQAVLRNLLRAIDCQPLFFYQLGLFSAMMNDRFQRLGDLAAGTMVVVEERHWLPEICRVADPQAIALAEQIPAVYRAPPSLGRALAAYVERRLAFPTARRTEIARHLAEPLIVRLGLPADTNPDHLLCAVYRRAFFAEEPPRGVPAARPLPPQPEPAARNAERTAGGSPFADPKQTAGRRGAP